MGHWTLTGVEPRVYDDDDLNMELDGTEPILKINIDHFTMELDGTEPIVKINMDHLNLGQNPY